MTPSITRTKINSRAARLLAVLFWLLVWQLAALLVGYEFLLASPLSVLGSLFALLLKGSTYLVALHSTLRVLLGFLSALMLALALSALATRFTLVKTLIAPLVAAARAVPVSSIVILAIILVSPRWLTALIAFVIGFPVIYTNLMEGLKARDKKLQEMAQVFAVRPILRLKLITLPQLLPYLRAGELTALGLCWKSGVAAEVIGIPRGSIGEQLYSVKVNYYTADLFAWTVIIVLLSLLCERLLRLLLDRGMKKAVRA